MYVNPSSDISHFSAIPGCTLLLESIFVSPSKLCNIYVVTIPIEFKVGSIVFGSLPILITMSL